MTQPIAEQERAVEQTFVDEVYDRLDEAPGRRRSSPGRATARASLGHEGGLVERDAMVFQAARRIAALDAAHEGLVFGRLDLVGGDARYIGRIGLRDAEREVMLVDWRAPAASVFYRATAQDPHGVVRRRVLRSRGPHGHRRRGRAARRRRRARGHGGRRRRRADGPAVAGPRRVHALGRRHHPEGAGRGDPLPRPRRDDHRRRTGHRQDRGRAAPRRLPALHRAPPLRVRRRAGRRAVRRVHELHRAGAAEPRRDQRDAAAARRRRRRHRRHPARRRRWWPGSRARPGCAGCSAGPPATSSPGAPEEFRTSGATRCWCSTRRDLAAVRRQLLGGGQRATARWPRSSRRCSTCCGAGSQGERALDRGRDAFVEQMRGDGPVGEFARAWWPALDAVQVWQWLHEPERLRRYATGVLEPDEVRAAAGRLAASTRAEHRGRAAGRRAALPARRRAAARARSRVPTTSSRGTP